MMSLALKIGLPLLAGLGLWAWLTTGAYNRGVAAEQAKIERYIAIQKKAVTEDIAGHERMSDDELDAALKKKCREAGGSEEQCA